MMEKVILLLGIGAVAMAWFIGYSVDEKGKIYPLLKDGGDQTYYVACHDFTLWFDKLSPIEFTYQWDDNGNDAKMVVENFVWSGSKFVSVVE